MPTCIQYGVSKKLQIEAEAAGVVDDSPDQSPAEPSSAEALTRAALLEPLGYPPLSSCLAPGDHIALAVAEGVPVVAGVVSGAVDALLEVGVDANRIAVITANQVDLRHLEERLKRLSGAGVEFLAHDPRDESELSFAGVTQNDQPVLLNRRLLNADVTIPVSCLRRTDQGLASVYGGLYPAFSDPQAIRAHGAEGGKRRPGESSRFATAADEVGWLIGAVLVLQAAPGVEGGVASVLAGPAESVTEAASTVFDRLWRRRVAERTQLAIATLTGDDREQTWANVARALASAEAILAPGGAVVLCTEVAEPLDQELAALLADDDSDRAARELSASASQHRDAARRLLDAREQGPVYLMSRLDSEVVEDLGLAPLANERELNRLASRRSDCVVLSGAQHVLVELADEE